MNDVLNVICDVRENAPVFSEETKQVKTNNIAKSKETKKKLPSELAKIVREILFSEHQIKVEGDLFSQEELQLIESIKIQNPNSKCKYIGFELLPNLSSLEITSGGQTELLPDELIYSISQEGMDSISKCKGLKKLIIKNQDNIENIDLSQTESLEEVTITRNQHLKRVTGLENLGQLTDLNLYGNNRMIAPKKLDSVILNNNLWTLNLDVLLFPDAIGFDHKSQEYRKDVFDKIRQIKDVRFVQRIAGTNYDDKLYLRQMVQIHNKACEILSEFIRPNSTKIDIIIGAQDYLARKVQYDTEGRNKGYIDSYGHKFRTNSLYNALINNRAVCEGYVSAMQYLLKLKGIRTHNCFCVIGRDEEFYRNQTLENWNNFRKRAQNNEVHAHSIIGIDGADTFYADPTSNASSYQEGDKSMPFILCTKEEIEKYVTLSLAEKDEEATIRPKSSLIKDSIRKSQLFIDTKMYDLAKTKGKIRDRVKGEIEVEERFWNE